MYFRNKRTTPSCYNFFAIYATLWSRVHAIKICYGIPDVKTRRRDPRHVHTRKETVEYLQSIECRVQHTSLSLSFPLEADHARDFMKSLSLILADDDGGVGRDIHGRNITTVARRKSYYHTRQTTRFRLHVSRDEMRRDNTHR